jgi:hypothetical protein
MDIMYIEPEFLLQTSSLFPPLCLVSFDAIWVAFDDGCAWTLGVEWPKGRLIALADMADHSQGPLSSATQLRLSSALPVR